MTQRGTEGYPRVAIKFQGAVDTLLTRWGVRQMTRHPHDSQEETPLRRIPRRHIVGDVLVEQVGGLGPASGGSVRRAVGDHVDGIVKKMTSNCRLAPS
jgi:hypothetical protein